MNDVSVKQRGRRRPQPKPAAPHAVALQRPLRRPELGLTVEPRPPKALFDSCEVAAVAAYGYDLYRADCLTDARIVFEGLVALDPHCGYLRRALAEVCLRQGEIASALAEADAAVSLDPSCPKARLQRSLVLLAAGKTNAAKADLQSAFIAAKSGPMSASVRRLIDELIDAA